MSNWLADQYIIVTDFITINLEVFLFDFKRQMCGIFITMIIVYHHYDIGLEYFSSQNEV